MNRDEKGHFLYIKVAREDNNKFEKQEDPQKSFTETHQFYQ